MGILDGDRDLTFSVVGSLVLRTQSSRLLVSGFFLATERYESVWDLLRAGCGNISQRTPFQGRGERVGRWWM